MIAGKDILNRAHGALVFGRRVRILAANLAKEIPIRAEVLDVGTGDGSIAKAIALHQPDIKIEGIDVLIRNAERKAWDYTHFRSRWSLADAFTLSHV